LDITRRHREGHQCHVAPKSTCQRVTH
jgi:hypothetical protein